MVYCTCIMFSVYNYSPLMSMGTTGKGCIGSPFRGCEYTCKKDHQLLFLFSSQELCVHTLSVACSTNVQFDTHVTSVYCVIALEEDWTTTQDSRLGWCGGWEMLYRLIVYCIQYTNVCDSLFIVCSIATPVVHWLHEECYRLYHVAVHSWTIPRACSHIHTLTCSHTHTNTCILTEIW